MKERRYFATLPERFGFLPRTLHSTGRRSIWFHAVSVGEVLSSVELIRRVAEVDPASRIYVSTSTLAGFETAERRLNPLGVEVFYAPLDFVSALRRTLRAVRPSVLVVMETEIWPNLYREAKRAGAALMVVNGRISDKKFPTYLRYRSVFRAVLSWPDTILVQSDRDAERYLALGASPIQVRAEGNLKFDVRPPSSGIAPEVRAFLDRSRPAKIWVAGSTVALDVDEDDLVLAAFKDVAEAMPGTLLILAPRKPGRFESVAAKLAAAGIPFARRSQLSPTSTGRVLLLDTIGELAAIYEVADVVFVGGSLAAQGGHNILEPAYFGKPVVVGPRMENFAEIAEEFGRAGALTTVQEAAGLAPTVIRLLREPGETGLRAQQLAQGKRGLVERVAAEIAERAAQSMPISPGTRWMRPLAWIWGTASAWNVGRSRARARKLNTRVISVGGLAMGGVGKSPFVEWLARKLADRNPAILTRGYRRQSKANLVVRRGTTAGVGETGDEAQAYVRKAIAHVGIGPDRVEVGRQVEHDLQPGVFVLDDGFQHTRLHRDVDIVLIDTLDPTSGGVFPVGRLRERPEALARANAIVLTRADFRQSHEGMIRWIRRYNADAPILRSRVVTPVVPTGKLAAFCGLGNPSAFWNTLVESGSEVVLRRAFADHHVYGEEELRHFAADAKAVGADVVVTTEKDAANLPARAAEALAPLQLHVVTIGVEVEDESRLLTLL